MSDRKLNEDEKEVISQELSLFTDQWAAHGTPLSSSFEIRNDHFVVLAVDDQINGASGCSIDSSVRIIKSIQEKIGIDFFNRSLVPFYIDGKVTLIERKNLRKKLEDRVWNNQTLTFNILAPDVGELKSSWLIEAERSWLKTFMKAGITLNL
jgi:hypothetical protein